MHESMISRETWKYECLSCLHEWQEEYEVRRSLDGHGGEAVIYSRMGLRCVSPWAEPCCPSCGGFNVKVLPTGWTAPLHPRHTGSARRRRTTPNGRRPGATSNGPSAAKGADGQGGAGSGPIRKP